ncbi:MAG TPA: 4-hydroxy-tetrahydrodipicolinate reductase, partial [Bacteroidia bacterium]|nr:4-hydroxy-tetrahydrodipicolinate reductase [Bacteroidia bacterium]
MKIALLGYGKMGKEIETAAIESGHQIVLKINSANYNQLNKESLQTADVAIE